MRRPDEKKFRRPKATAKSKYWSAHVTATSFALELEEGVFTWDDPKKIAQSLKTSADASTQRKSAPFRSAMSMLVFYINRAGRNLGKDKKAILESAKEELRKLYGRT
jgi:hypothetical protein